MEIQVHTKQHTYPILMERGILSHVKDYIEEGQRVYIISDDGVPEKWKKIVLGQFDDAILYTFPHGEHSKSLQTYEKILKDMLQHQLSRKDIVIGLGGGVVGDMSGFVAASYMRGISYINIPTTTLSQIDSSIGGKTAVNLDGIKNCVGAFWQPSYVLIDPDVLSTLPKRQFNNGLVEAVKEGLIKDPTLFELFEKENIEESIEEILERALQIKRKIVEEDEREQGQRKLLNFGHTFGHAYESYYDMDRYLHGECVGLGMMKVLKNDAIKQRLEKVLKRLDVPTECDADPEEIYQLMHNDKKANQETVDIVQVHEIGNGVIEKWTWEDVRKELGL